MNDGSTDGTEQVAQRFASKDVKVVSTENQGPSSGSQSCISVEPGRLHSGTRFRRPLGTGQDRAAAECATRR